MDISAEKTKLMTNDASGINTEIKVNRQKLETVPRFKYLDSVLTDECSQPEILSINTEDQPLGNAHFGASFAQITSIGC